jgi:crossover junction endodeoxyribonuclease RuvC
MLQRLLKIADEDMGKFMDATDALAAAYCHFLQMGRPESPSKYHGWKDFVRKNQDKVSQRKTPVVLDKKSSEEDNP